MGAERSMPPAIRSGSTARPTDRLIADLAGRQHGVVSRAQLLAAGFSPAAIGRRLTAGRLHVVHPGVYSVGHALVSAKGRWMAAVLAAGEEGVLSHRSAGALWGVCADPSAFVETTTPEKHARRPGLRPHRGVPGADEVTTRDGIPVTTIERTLIDLAAVLPRHRLTRAVEQAEILRLLDIHSLTSLMERHRGRRGIARLRLVLAQLGETGARVTRSELEDRFLAFLDRAGLPKPETNAYVRAGGRWFEVDCLWRAEGVVVELDGYAVHGTRRAFEADRERLRKLTTAGLQAVAVTWRQITADAEDLERDLRALLRRRGVDRAR